LMGEFRKLMGSELGLKDVEGKSTYELLLSDKKMLVMFGDEVKNSLKHFSHNELVKGIKTVAGSQSSLLKELANELKGRNVVPSYQGVFLDILVKSDPFNTPAEVSNGLAAGIQGDIKRESIAAFGRWYDVGAEKALLAVCALKPNSDLGEFAIRTLSGRSLKGKTAKKLISWVNSNFEEHRKKLAQPIGILGLGEIASPEEAEFAINSLIPYSDGQSVLNLISATEDIALLRTIVKSLNTSLDSGELLKLAEHPDKEIRIASVKGLEGRNDLHVLREILEAYKNEKDPEVREAYESLHWITRDRERDF